MMDVLFAKESFMDKNRINLYRHHDDEYIDQIKIKCYDDCLVNMYLSPRYKMSELSGDEWRVSANLEIMNYDGDGVAYSTSYHNISYAQKFAPYFIWKNVKSYLNERYATIYVYRKNNLIWHKTFPTFGDAVIGLPWHITVAGESDINWKHLPDSEEADYCQQPGCINEPTKLFRMKKFQVSRQSSIMSEDFTYPGTYRYIWFCDKHSERGDAGLQDRDSNYELIDPNNYEKGENSPFRFTNKHIGSTLDSLLVETGDLEDVNKLTKQTLQVCKQCSEGKYICIDCFNKSGEIMFLDLAVYGAHKCKVCHQEFDGKYLRIT